MNVDERRIIEGPLLRFLVLDALYSIHTAYVKVREAMLFFSFEASAQRFTYRSSGA